MAATAPLPQPAAPSPWRRRARNVLLALVALTVAFVAFGYWAVPPLAKAKLEALLHDELGRTATIGRIAFDPFTLKATIGDFALADRTPGAPLFAFDELTLDLSSTSLWRAAPVLDAVRVTRPRLTLVRNADGSYNIQDLIERILAAPPGPPPRFSLNNIEIDDGAITLDDKPHGRVHEIAHLGVGIPFLSSLPYAAEIRVVPRLAASVNGSAFALGGSASSPFVDVKEATLEINLDDVPLPRYVDYATLPFAGKVKDGSLTTRLSIAFVSDGTLPRTLKVRGTARVDHLALTRNDGSPLVSAGHIEAAVGELDALARTLKLDRVVVDAPTADLVRLRDGSLEIAHLLAPVPAARAVAAKPAAAPVRPWTVTIAAAKIGNGTLALSDDSITPAFRATLANVTVDAAGLSTVAGPPAHLTLAFDSDGARFDGTCDLDIATLAARGHFALSKFSLARLYPYYASALALDVRHGALALAGDFDVAAGVTPLQVKLASGAATLTDVELAVSEEREALWRVPEITLAGIAFDLAGHRVAIESAEAKNAAMRVIREADGGLNFARLMRTTAQTGTGTATSAAPADATWTLVLQRALIDRSTADVEDRGATPPVKLRLMEARALLQNYSNARGAKSTVDFRARVGTEGRIALVGPVSTNPVAADWRVDAAGLDLLALRPYLEARTNLVITGGRLSTRGRLALDATAPGGTHASYAGDATVSDFGSLDRPTAQELARWKTLTLTGVDVASDPARLAVGSVLLDDFFARVIVNPDATLNLQRVMEAPESTAAAVSAAAPAPAVPDAPKARVATPAKAAPRQDAAARLAQVAAPMSGAQDLPVSIGRIDVTHGTVHFSDFFVRPNYSANLTDLAGSVSAMSAAQAGDVLLDAKVEETAPVEIRGKINPFAPVLTLDLIGRAHDIDLPPLTPYAAKYAGYGIEKGKLSFDVHYKIDDRKLTADNKLVLDQLTFGARVDSPTATKLPVLLAVALLKDRHGVIDIELPISGSLDDPQFSMGGLIVRVIINLITKVVTAPFAVLGALAGGGPQLAYVEFAPGRAALSPASEAKLRTLAKALADRPALKLDVTGRAIPDADRDGLKRAQLERAVRLSKQRAQGGGAPASVDAITVEAADYPRLVAAVYDDAKLPDKPKNALGFAKEIPVADMEALLLASYPVDDEALRALANERAQAVKTWLAESGGIAPERMFLVASKLGADGVKDDGAPTRVDFALK